MGGPQWKYPHYWSTTPPAVSRQRRESTGRETGPTSSSRFPVRPQVSQRSKSWIFAGVPINVTLLFSCEQYLASAQAYLNGIERRIAAGLDPLVDSVASLFVSRWDAAVANKVPDDLHNRLGIAIAKRTYRVYREMLASPRWRKLTASGARPQRLLWASTGTKDPKAPDTLYIEALAAPDTINTIPEKNLHAFAEHGKIQGAMAVDGGDAEAVLTRFAQAGIDIGALAIRLQT